MMEKIEDFEHVDVMFAWLMMKHCIDVQLITHGENEEDDDIKPGCFKIIAYVNCNDTFAYACGDAEEVTTEEDIRTLFADSFNNPKWGPIIWASRKCGHKPVIEVQEWMKAENCWTEEMDSLEESFMGSERW